MMMMMLTMTTMMTVTWLNNADVEDFLDVSVVGGDLEDGGRLALNARDVDRHDIVRYTTPADVSVLFLHLEYLRPQSAAGHHTHTAHLCSRRRCIIQASLRDFRLLRVDNGVQLNTVTM